MSKSLRILIVDDDEVDRIAVRRALRKIHEDAVIEEAAGLRPGMEALAGAPFDCALVDYVLPDGNGASFAKEVNALPHPAPPVIILTGRGDREMDLEAMKAGAAEYLEKNELDEQRLERAIRYAIQNHQLVQKLKETNEKLKELDKLKTEFLSTASHELRTPLAIIREFIALVRDGITGPLNEEQSDCLNSALKNCDRLGGIINDLLDLQRIESGAVVLTRRRVDPAAILELCCRDFRPACERKGQRLLLAPGRSLPPVLCDEEKITQVLVNLLGNAHKFTQEGGEIRLDCDLREGEVVLSVQDNGPGIRLEDQWKIFDKCTQISRKAGPGKNGTGLGLAICKRILEMHGGGIRVESEPGKGAKFSFSLPRYDDEGALRSFVVDRMERSRSLSKDWTLLLIRGTGGGSVFWDPVKLERIEAVARRSMRSQEDSVLHLEDIQAIAMMLQCPLESAVHLQERLSRAIEFDLGPGLGLLYEIFPVEYENAEAFAREAIEKVMSLPGIAGTCGREIPRRGDSADTIGKERS